MKTKSIYLLRHGETDYNKNGMVQGRGVNASLNENGRNQAKAAFDQLKDIGFDQLYASALVRTHETLAPFSTDFIPLDGFDEISWGNQEGVKASLEARNLYAETVENWKKGQLDLNVGGGESPREVMARQQQAMQKVLDNAYDKVLICMHGRAMRVLLCWLLNYPLNYMDGFPHHNCSYYSLQFNGNTFAIRDFNASSHLNG